MRRPSFRTQLIAAFLGLVVVAESIALWALDRGLGEDLIAQLDARLVTQAEGAANWISQRRADHQPGAQGYDRHAERLSRVVDAWVTVVGEDDRIQGDSRIEDEAVRVAERAGSPELDAARGGRLARATRWSSALGAQVYFIAAPARNGAVVRLGVPLSTIEATRANIRGRLLVAALLASLVALGLGLVATRLIAGPLREMTLAAERIARGDYAVPPSDPTPDELGALSRTLGSLAAQLEARIGELTGERDRLSAVLAGMVEGVLVLDADGTVALANPSARNMLGDAPIRELLAAPPLTTLLAEPADGGFAELEHRGLSLIVTHQRLRGAGGLGSVLVLHDVTERQKLESLRRDFVAQISHELRTPVAAIQGYAETLIEAHPDDATRAEFLQVIHRQAIRMGRLVGDLLRLAELEARPADAVRDTPVQLAPVVAHVVRTVRDRAAEAGVSLVVDMPEGLCARGDEDDLEQVVENLVDNAIRYGARPGTVAISAGAGTAGIELRVRDDGPGIGAEHLPRLFERFYRVDPARSRKLGGTGLGLAIVARLVATMRGEVRADSAPGQGTTFTVTLPPV